MTRIGLNPSVIRYHELTYNASASYQLGHRECLIGHKQGFSQLAEKGHRMGWEKGFSERGVATFPLNARTGNSLKVFDRGLWLWLMWRCQVDFNAGSF